MAFQKAIFDNKKLIDIELKGCLLTIVNYGPSRHYLCIESKSSSQFLVPGIFLLGQKK